MNLLCRKNNGIKNWSILLSFALVTTAFITATDSSPAGRGLPCEPHPGKPFPDETISCLGNFSTEADLGFTSGSLVYHSLDSDLDKHYGSTPPAHHFSLGYHWKHTFDASLFFSSDGQKAFLIQADGSSLIYSKNNQGTYWPEDPRQTQSWIVWQNDFPLYQNIAGIKASFSFKDSSEVYHLTQRRGAAGQVMIDLVRDDEGKIIQFTGHGLNPGSLLYSSGQVIVRDAIGQQTYLTKNSNNVLTQLSYSNNISHQFTYNEKSLMTSHSHSLGNNTTIDYYESQLVKSIADKMNLATHYRYLANKVLITSLEGEQEELFDNGKLLETKNFTTGESTVLRRDSQDRVIGATLNGSLTSQITYGSDDRSNILSFFPSTVSRPDGVTSSIEYFDFSGDGQRILLPKKITLTGPSGASQTQFFEYDEFFRRTRINEGGQITTLSYANLSNGSHPPLPTEIKVGNQTLMTASYDGNGNLVRSTDQSGAVSTFSYDTQGRLLSMSKGGITHRYTYDQLNRTTRIATPEGTISRGFGQLGNLERETVTLSSGGTRVQEEILSLE